MFGDTVFQPDAVLAPLDAYAPPAPPPDDPALAAPFLAPAPLPKLLPYDTWGAIQIPTVAGIPFTPVATKLWVGQAQVPSSDPALAVILDYLATFLVTDKNATAAWAAIAGQSAKYGAVKRVFAHDPSEWSFSAEDLPALFLWRDDGKQTWDADDWARDHTTLKLLWVYALGTQENNRARQPFGNVLEKLITVAIERGRTPGWVQPGDKDPDAATQGSVFWFFAGFDELSYDSWRKATLRIPNAEDAYPAIELTLSMTELWQQDLGRYSPIGDTFEQLYDGNTGNPTVGGWLNR